MKKTLKNFKIYEKQFSRALKNTTSNIMDKLLKFSFEAAKKQQTFTIKWFKMLNCTSSVKFFSIPFKTCVENNMYVN